MDALNTFLSAAEMTQLPLFLERATPPGWAGIRARILESGATFHDSRDARQWAPRWTPIPLTVKDTPLKTIIYRVHDALHQLWGLPAPGDLWDEGDRYYYKRAQMCGEVAVLTLVEFDYCAWVAQTFPSLRGQILRRNALPLIQGPDAPLAGKSRAQIAMRLDELLHKKVRPRWVRQDPVALAFVADYVPMLENDREQIDTAWAALREQGPLPPPLRHAPKARFGRNLSGLELTLWMIADFEHLLSSTPDVDLSLAAFNRERRARIQLPPDWPT